MKSWNLFLVGLVAALFGTKQGAQAQPTQCGSITQKCQCRPDNPLVVLIILDVSRSIDVDDMFDKYLPVVEKLDCGLSLGLLSNNEPDKDAIGLVTFGYDTKVSVPLKRYTHENWRFQMSAFKRGKRVTRYFARRCCTPMADAFELARNELTVADQEGRIDVARSRVVLHVITDGYPVQNRLRRSPKQKFKQWTQEKMYPSYYRLQMVPQKAESIKDKFGDVTINTFLLQNRRGLSRNEAEDYFLGDGLTSETSRKRRPYVNKMIYRGRERTHTPDASFPIVSLPASQHVANILDSQTIEQIITQQIDYICPGDTTNIGSQCPSMGTPFPTKFPTVSPTAFPTKFPTASPVDTPTPAPPPTRPVQTCGGPKDLIFILDASNSISDRKASVNRLTESILPLTRDLQRIQEEQPGYNTALITFSNLVKERIPLGFYTYSQFSDQIEILRTNSQSYTGCCTPTAEALELARDILLDRDVAQEAIVFLLTDGQPFPNKDNYETADDNPPVIPTTSPSRPPKKNYRRPNDCNVNMPNGQPPPAGCEQMTYAEYVSRKVFQAAEELKAVGPKTSVYVVGFPTKDNEPTKVEYFSGAEQGQSCTTPDVASHLWLCDSNCNSCSQAGADDPDCWAKQSRNQNSCSSSSDFYGPIVSEPASSHAVEVDVQTVINNDLDSLVQQLRNFICNETP